MPHPTQKATKSRKNIRRGAISLKKSASSKCSNCGRVIKPHTVCKFCGHYNKKKVLEFKLKNRKERKEAEKQEKKAQKEKSKKK